MYHRFGKLFSDLYSLARNNMSIFRSNLKLLKNDVHKSQVVLIDDYYLNKINSNNYDEINLLLPLIKEPIKVLMRR